VAIVLGIDLILFVNFGQNQRCRLFLLSLHIWAILKEDWRRIIWDELLPRDCCSVRLRDLTAWL